MSSPRNGPAFGTLAFAGVAVAAVSLVVLGPPRDRSGDRSAPPRPATTPAPASVTAGGFTLRSASVELPSDDLAFPAGPHRDAVEANCTACHSPAMILSQPPLQREVWEAEVKKMREAYHAPVDPAAVPNIVEYLTGLGENS